ncbi:hypothetical protein GJ688_17080 [Heliobacillus mobilis]|uniref:Uncharacterized protein n=1 Tax=Heliobacterium mobile TaxID=28064 RepID=A0A6I3SQG2_HELMO|nr:hypothetical protein [Heliobacterium mobile]
MTTRDFHIRRYNGLMKNNSLDRSFEAAVRKADRKRLRKGDRELNLFDFTQE